MSSATSVELVRDCDAIQIPVGNTVTLPAGTAVDIAQTLGGNYTVHAMGGLFRIDGRNADALGFEATDASQTAPTVIAPTESGKVDEQALWNVLRTVYDPEIPVNIVDLGLIYDLTTEPAQNGQLKVSVKMTLTAPGCGMGTAIAGDAQQKLLDLPGVDEASVELVWDPPWHQSMITEQGRRVLGLN